MRKLLSVVVLIALSAQLLRSPCSAATDQTRGQSYPTPLIGRELIFVTELSNMEISPDGKYVAFIKAWHGVSNIWVKETSQPFNTATLLTTETRSPIRGYFWSRDGAYILYVGDTDGDENFNIHAVSPVAEAAVGFAAPPSRDLTGLKGVQVRLYSVPQNNPDVAFIGLNERDQSWHDLYRLQLSTGKRTLVRKNTERITSWVFDLQGQLRLATRVADNGDKEILRVDPEQFTQIYSCSVFESCAPVTFQKSGNRVYVVTNKGDDQDLQQLVLLDPQNGSVEKVESDPLDRADIRDMGFSNSTGELEWTLYEDERPRLYFRDKGIKADYEWLRKNFPGDEISFAGTLNDRLWLVTAWSDIEPGTIYLYNRDTRHLVEQYKLREKLPRQDLTPMRSVHYQSSDGLEIPAYLLLPKGLPETGLPTLVMPHGGPWLRDSWTFDPLAQFFANRGYAVLMPNFRGSTGYGKRFFNAGNGEWGHKMQDDITWGVKYLVSQGITDPKHVGILGASYGGYAALAGATFTPDVYAAAVDLDGPSDLTTLLSCRPPYWESGLKSWYVRVGDPSTNEGRTMLRERSPLYAADRIKTPLVVVQGTNDPRVNRSQSDQLVSAMQRHGIQVEYLLAPDEGHSFAQYINAMAVFMTVEKLLAEHLGGRYQEAVPWQVSERLKAITVDPKSMVQLSSRSSVSIVSIPALGVLASTPKGGGAEIVGIQPRSAADLAGLHVADVIKFANDKPARTATELASLLSDHPSENTIRIGYTFPTSALGYLPKETVVHLQRVCGLGIPEN